MLPQMIYCRAIWVGLLVVCSLAHAAEPRAIVDSVASETLNFFKEKNLRTNQFAMTLVDLADSAAPQRGSFRGDAPIYPASVIKLFYLVAAHRWLEDGKIQDSEELRRAMRDMIVDSGNEPAHYVVDLLTETTSGPELSEDTMREWISKRNAVNRHYAGLGYTNINANQKPWCEGPYGRERVFVGKNFENRNALTTDGTARLLTEIALEKSITASRSREMLKLLEREPFKKPNSDQQAAGYTGGALPEGARLWSKAGWTSTARHDAAFVQLPNGRQFVLVTFTTGHANNKDIIPFVARKVIAALQ